MDAIWGLIPELSHDIGWFNTIVIIVFWAFYRAMVKMYDARLKDRQDQIDKLAKENHEYRERFNAMMDKQLGYKRKK